MTKKTILPIKPNLLNSLCSSSPRNSTSETFMTSAKLFMTSHGESNLARSGAACSNTLDSFAASWIQKMKKKWICI